MKKILVLFLCLAVVSSSCFAKRQKKQQSAEEKTSEHVVEEQSTEQNAEVKAKERKSSSEREQRRQEKAQLKEERNAKAEADKIARDLKSKGWSVVPASAENGFSEKTIIAKNGKNVSVEKGIVRIQTFSENGSVAFFVLEKSGAWHPVVETNDRAESTFISLFVDRTEYRLNRSKKVDYSYEIEGDCVSVVYKIRSVAQLKATYRIEGYSIYVSYSVLNLDSKPHDFAVKAVYNTVLGETYAAHFATPSRNVGAELSIAPSSTQDYILSGDGTRTIRFAVFGNGITPPKMALLANKDVVEEATFATAFKDGRSFSSLLSYNNSSVAFFWAGENVGAKNGELRYRIDFSNTEFEAKTNEPFPPFVPPEIEEPQPPLEVAPQVPPEAEVVPPMEPPASEEPDEPIPDQEFNTERKYMPPSSVDEVYVQRLIEQINSLEASDPALNRERIRELQDEIDEVLDVLRSRR